MENYNLQRSSGLGRTTILLSTASCLLAASAFVGGELRAAGGRGSSAYGYLPEPTALLTAAYGLWRGGVLGDAVASLAPLLREFLRRLRVTAAGV